MSVNRSRLLLAPFISGEYNSQNTLLNLLWVPTRCLCQERTIACFLQQLSLTLILFRSGLVLFFCTIIVFFLLWGTFKWQHWQGPGKGHSVRLRVKREIKEQTKITLNNIQLLLKFCQILARKAIVYIFTAFSSDAILVHTTLVSLMWA